MEYFDIQNSDYVALNNYLSLINWNLRIHNENINVMGLKFYNILMNACLNFVSVKKVRSSKDSLCSGPVEIHAYSVNRCIYSFCKPLNIIKLTTLWKTIYFQINKS